MVVSRRWRWHWRRLCGRGSRGNRRGERLRHGHGVAVHLAHRLHMAHMAASVADLAVDSAPGFIGGRVVLHGRVVAFKGRVVYQWRHGRLRVLRQSSSGCGNGCSWRSESARGQAKRRGEREAKQGLHGDPVKKYGATRAQARAGDAAGSVAAIRAGGVFWEDVQGRQAQARPASDCWPAQAWRPPGAVLAPAWTTVVHWHPRCRRHGHSRGQAGDRGDRWPEVQAARCRRASDGSAAPARRPHWPSPPPQPSPAGSTGAPLPQTPAGAVQRSAARAASAEKGGDSDVP